MSGEELEGYETESQLALYQEYKNVAELFTYVVETDRRFYLANEVEVTPMVAGQSVYFYLEMKDVWVWDVFRSHRFVKSVNVYSFKDVNIEERAQAEELVVPDIADFSD